MPAVAATDETYTAYNPAVCYLRDIPIANSTDDPRVNIGIPADYEQVLYQETYFGYNPPPPILKSSWHAASAPIYMEAVAYLSRLGSYQLMLDAPYTLPLGKYLTLWHLAPTAY
jgi:hypothetical protein